MDQSLWQTSESIDFIYSSYEWIQTVFSCEKSAKQCRLGLFQDSDFTGDVEDSKSTSGGTLCVFGSHTCVPISWICKKQTAVSHSSTESEIISLDTGLKLDGLPALELWDLIVSVFGNVSRVSYRSGNLRVCLLSVAILAQVPRPLRAWWILGTEARARDGGLGVVPASIVSSGECDSQFTLSTVLSLFSVQLSTRRVRVSQRPYWWLQRTKGLQLSTCWYSVFSRRSMGRSATAMSPGTRNRPQMRHALFSAPLPHVSAVIVRPPAQGGIKKFWAPLSCRDRCLDRPGNVWLTKSQSGSSVKEKTLFCCSERHVFQSAQGSEISTFSLNGFKHPKHNFRQSDQTTHSLCCVRNRVSASSFRHLHVRSIGPGACHCSLPFGSNSRLSQMECRSYWKFPFDVISQDVIQITRHIDVPQQKAPSRNKPTMFQMTTPPLSAPNASVARKSRSSQGS